jgi:hypothetical protein
MADVARLALIHTVAGNEPLFAGLVGELLPGVEATAMVDETLLADAVRDGGLREETADRLRRHVSDAEVNGADPSSSPARPSERRSMRPLRRRGSRSCGSTSPWRQSP